MHETNPQKYEPTAHKLTNDVITNSSLEFLIFLFFIFSYFDSFGGFILFFIGGVSSGLDKTFSI